MDDLAPGWAGREAEGQATGGAQIVFSSQKPGFLGQFAPRGGNDRLARLHLAAETGDLPRAEPGLLEAKQHLGGRIADRRSAGHRQTQGALDHAICAHAGSGSTT